MKQESTQGFSALYISRPPGSCSAYAITVLGFRLRQHPHSNAFGRSQQYFAEKFLGGHDDHFVEALEVCFDLAVESGKRVEITFDFEGRQAPVSYSQVGTAAPIRDHHFVDQYRVSQHPLLKEVIDDDSLDCCLVQSRKHDSSLS
ncbi:hypothetical protein AQ919_29880 [Burkholderia pseudomallei]|nr:hypothetical protein AQ919_29880 [Burkholderia pseudomallei]ONC73971.1 hypothetical protein AQ921_09020 [Burkholderia pseudomallei]